MSHIEAFLFPLDGSPYRDSVKPRDHAVFNRQVLSSARLQFYRSRSTAVPAFSVPGPRTTSSRDSHSGRYCDNAPTGTPGAFSLPRTLARSPFTDITPDTLLAAAPELSGAPQWNSISAGNCRRLAGFILQFKNTPQGLHMKWTTGGFTYGGALFDRYGRRMYYVSATALLWILVYSLMGFTQVRPMVPAILGSVALSFSAIPFIAAIPLLAPSQEYLGTVRIWSFLSTAAGIVIMDVSAGAIQDRTPTGTHTYHNILYFLIAIKAIDVVYGLLYHVLDVCYFRGVLRMSEAEKLRDVQRQESEGTDVLKKPVKLWTVLGFGVMFTITGIAVERNLKPELGIKSALTACARAQRGTYDEEDA
ncbi:hypothetical protein DFH09DRAFT_1459292 [Mycena vulgaris]|nr:hypothetical protein DFH09DRAFT_1459292 [Mycena vulgaris]